MNKILTALLTFVMLFSVGHSAAGPTPAKIPSELVGEWATAKSQFARGALTSGSAIYLLADGTALFLGAPPPIGIRGTAVYEPAAHSLTVTLLDDDDGGRPRQMLVLAYDVSAKTLALSPAKSGDVYKRQRDQVPDYILKDIETAKSRTNARPV